MNKITNEDFEEIKEKGEDLYKSFQEVYCPYLKEKITFNSEGLSYLRFKNFERCRPELDQYMRFKLIHLAPLILSLSRTVQGIQETKQFERVRMHSRTEVVLKAIIYYEFIALIGRNRVKVIVKQIENGPKFFWSIIPLWKMNSQTGNRILHDGNPTED